MVFWPSTTLNGLVSCPKCQLTTLLGGFDKLPKDKLPAIRKVLKAHEQKSTAGKDQSADLAQRLKIAESVYRQLDKDKSFWCFFQRMAGYLLDKDGKPKEAALARRKALANAEAMEKEGPANAKKEPLYIQGAMLAYLGDKEKALSRLKAAAATPVTPGGPIKAEQAENMNRFINSLAQELIQKLESGQKLP